MSTINLKIEFGGGLELLFGNVRSHAVSLPTRVPASNSTTPSPPGSVPTQTPPESGDAAGDTKPADVDYLIHHLRDHVLKERSELFMEGNTVRPGILVLINDTDWELEGDGSYQLCDLDEIVFISTLHGG
ncbi:ubiquitin-like modifier 1 [Paxillus ammoniavirescens]|nr:ubiquitin-like modifier 1 [Paxillus ammoniavirescens]